MPNRCTHCKQVGHNRTTCPHDAWYAVELRETYNAERREEQRRYNERVRASLNSANEARRIVGELEQRIQLLGNSYRQPQANSRAPTAREIKVQEILFEHSEELSDGLYKQLMDALVIKD